MFGMVVYDLVEHLLSLNFIYYEIIVPPLSNKFVRLMYILASQLVHTDGYW